MALAWAPPAPAAPLRIDQNDVPATLEADRVQSEAGGKTVAQGDVRLIHGELRLSTELLEYTAATQEAVARGQVLLQQAGNELRGREARMRLDTREGSVDDARYHFARTGGGGVARRVDFFGDQRLIAQQAVYSSCRIDDPDTADWVLSADRLDLDFEHNDGRAEHAVLRFLGVPILAAPVLSFPATGERRSGWLPPTIYPVDSRNGLELEVPYYLNLAPQHDLTLTPGLLTRRGVSLGAEFRYLQPQDEGRLVLNALPNDRAANRDRSSLLFEHQGGQPSGLSYSASVQTASDDDYWKDFSRALPSLTPRLLPQDLRARQRLALGDTELEAYARVLGWRTLQDADAPITPPYQRAPQLGLRAEGRVGPGLLWSSETEYNRFMLRDRFDASDARPGGQRAHWLGTLRWPHEAGWGWFTPAATVNTAAYDLDSPMADGRRRTSRTVPTLSADAGLRFERAATLWGRELRQTLEPRVHYVYTPWRQQDLLPNFDSSANDFNELSIYRDNAFSGTDFVSDAHQVTLGASSRWFDQGRGAELLRLGIAQRYLFSPTRITPERLGATGLATEGVSSTARFSDMLLFGSATLIPDWRFDANLQFNADEGRTTRTIMAVRWQPQPFHTLSATYRYARDLTDQVELGWQWPLYRREGQGPADACTGALYGVGRINYSRRDGRLTDGIAGVEYDAGCWIGRVVANRVSTGTTESTTRLMVQLELVGLSRLGSNPLKVLKENVPGYRLLRDDNATDSSAP